MDIFPPALLVMGPPGSGKTDSLITLMEAGLELFVLVTEPRGVESLLDSLARRKRLSPNNPGLAIERLHWSYVAPTAGSWRGLTDMATKVSTMGYKDLSELKSGIGKESNNQWIKMLNQIANFHCDRENKDYGDVTEFGPDRAFSIDSLSGLNEMAKQITVGFKPAIHQGEWGVAMEMLNSFCIKMAADCKCTFVLTAHVERNQDLITGGTKVMVGALGQRLAPKLPRFFSEVVLTSTDGTTYSWSNKSVIADLKRRSLPISDSLAPTFVPVIDSYRERLKLAGGGQGGSSSAASTTQPK
jgi:hypothetical protein